MASSSPSHGPISVAVALGSNLGDRRTQLEWGVRALKGFLEQLRLSSVYETEPVYVADQPEFLNACCTGVTWLAPHQLLSQLLDFERAAGRVRSGPQFGPRALDLDLLLYGDRVLESRDLVVPHPRMRERAFVIVPLAEIAADWIVPASGGQPERMVSELLYDLDATGVRRVSALRPWGEEP